MQGHLGIHFGCQASSRQQTSLLRFSVFPSTSVRGQISVHASLQLLPTEYIQPTIGLGFLLGLSWGISLTSACAFGDVALSITNGYPVRVPGDFCIGPPLLSFSLPAGKITASQVKPMHATSHQVPLITAFLRPYHAMYFFTHVPGTTFSRCDCSLYHPIPIVVVRCLCNNAAFSFPINNG